MFSFKGIHAKDMGLIVNAINRSILPPLTHKLTPIPGGVGAYDFGVDLSPRVFTFNISIIEEAQENMGVAFRPIADWLYSRTLEPLVFNDEPDKTYDVRLVNATDITEILNLGQGTLEFIAPNPLAYGQLIDLYPGNPITYNGTYPSGPIIKGTFTEDSAVENYLKTEQLETGEFVHVRHLFKAGDVVEIDCQKKMVTLNGEVRNDLLTLDSDFITMQRGTNTFRNTTAGSTVAMRVLFRDYFL